MWLAAEVCLCVCGRCLCGCMRANGGGGGGGVFFVVYVPIFILAEVSHSGAVMVVVSPWGHWVG